MYVLDNSYRLDLDTLGDSIARADRLRAAVSDPILDADTIEDVAHLWGVDITILARAYLRLTDNRGNRPGRDPRARFTAFAAASEASDQDVADRFGFTVRAIAIWRGLFSIPTCTERRAAIAAAPARAPYPKPAGW